MKTYKDLLAIGKRAHALNARWNRDEAIDHHDQEAMSEEAMQIVEEMADWFQTVKESAL